MVYNHSTVDQDIICVCTWTTYTTFDLHRTIW